MSELELVVTESRTLEKLLRAKFPDRAVGNGLGELARSVEEDLSPDVMNGIRWIARQRNLLVHDGLEIESVTAFRDRVQAVKQGLGVPESALPDTSANVEIRELGKLVRVEGVVTKAHRSTEDSFFKGEKGVLLLELGKDAVKVACSGDWRVARGDHATLVGTRDGDRILAYAFGNKTQEASGTLVPGQAQGFGLAFMTIGVIVGVGWFLGTQAFLSEDSWGDEMPWFNLGFSLAGPGFGLLFFLVGLKFYRLAKKSRTAYRLL